MVLTRAAWVLLVCSAAACLPRPPVARLENRTPVLVVYVFDPEGQGAPAEVPQGLADKVAAALAERNLEAVTQPARKYPFDRVRESAQRFREVAKTAEVPLVMLVEARARFFSQVNERYRWNVDGRITAGKRAKPDEAAVSAFEDAAFLDYDHQREPDALVVASGTFAKKAGALVDQVLSADVAPRAAAPRGRDPGAVYFILVDRFANGDPSNDGAVDRTDPQGFHGGDLQGVLDHLDDLQRLGVGTVWLSPIFKTRQEKFFGYGAFHGYWVEDLTQVEPRFGTVEKLAELSSELHRRGMRLLLDMVLNHVAFDAPLLTEHPDWFHHQGNLEDWTDPVQLTQRDVKGLPDLAQEKEPVYRYLLQASFDWIDRVHPDGFRLDAVKHVPVSFWARYNDAIHARAGNDFELLGEELEGDAAQVSRVQREGHFDAMFDFPLHFALIDVFCRGAAPERLGAVLSNDRLYADPGSLVTLLDNHDLPRLLTSCGGDVEKARAALFFQLAMRGTPALTYGTEAGLEGAKEPENRGDMRFGQGGPLPDAIREVLALRREHPALQRGVPWILEAGRGVFVYARVAPEELALITVDPKNARRAGLPPELKDLSVEAAPERAGPVQLLFAKPRVGDLRALAERLQRAAAQRDVRFAVRAPPGEALYVVGSAPELGGWNPKKALGPLGADGEARSRLPVGAVVEYKLVAVPRAGAPRWEPGDNHVLFVRDGQGPLTLELSWTQG